MKRHALLLVLVGIFVITNGFFCDKKTNCHDFRVEVSYDGVEQLTAQTFNGQGPFTFKWDGGLGNGSIAIAPGPGTYTVHAFDFNKCEAIYSYTIK